MYFRNGNIQGLEKMDEAKVGCWSLSIPGHSQEGGKGAEEALACIIETGSRVLPLPGRSSFPEDPACLAWEDATYRLFTHSFNEWMFWSTLYGLGTVRECSVLFFPGSTCWASCSSGCVTLRHAPNSGPVARGRGGQLLTLEQIRCSLWGQGCPLASLQSHHFRTWFFKAKIKELLPERWLMDAG